MNDCGEVKINKQVLVFFSIGRYKDEVLCDIVPLHVPIGPITKARFKKIKEALNRLIQEIWADSNARHSKFGPKEDEGVINLIQDIEG